MYILNEIIFIAIHKRKKNSYCSIGRNIDFDYIQITIINFQFHS